MPVGCADSINASDGTDAGLGTSGEPGGDSPCRPNEQAEILQSDIDGGNVFLSFPYWSECACRISSGSLRCYRCHARRRL